MDTRFCARSEDVPPCWPGGGPCVRGLARCRRPGSCSQSGSSQCESGCRAPLRRWRGLRRRQRTLLREGVADARGRRERSAALAATSPCTMCASASSRTECSRRWALSLREAAWLGVWRTHHRELAPSTHHQANDEQATTAPARSSTSRAGRRRTRAMSRPRRCDGAQHVVGAGDGVPQQPQRLSKSLARMRSIDRKLRQGRGRASAWRCAHAGGGGRV